VKRGATRTTDGSTHTTRSHLLISTIRSSWLSDASCYQRRPRRSRPGIRDARPSRHGNSDLCRPGLAGSQRQHGAPGSPGSKRNPANVGWHWCEAERVHPSSTEPLHLFQIWIEPATTGTQPTPSPSRVEPIVDAPPTAATNDVIEIVRGSTLRHPARRGSRIGSCIARSSSPLLNAANRRQGSCPWTTSGRW
jgi:hypothetical protein